MGISCCAFGCKEKFVKGGKITFHSFPKDEERRKLWTRNLRRDKFVPSAYSKICSKHFKEDCFDRNKFGGTWLTSEAIPTIFDFPKHLQPKSVSRKPPAVRTLNTSSIVDTDLPKEPVVTVNMDVVKPSKAKYRYLGDFKTQDMSCPVKAEKALQIAKQALNCKRREIKKLRREQVKLKRKIDNMQPILDCLKNKMKISDEICQILENSLPGAGKALVERAVGGRRKTYPPELKAFALTLQFYSCKAYDYVRKTFQCNLPHPSTLRKWYGTVDGTAGFTPGSITALRAKSLEASQKGKKVYCALIVDEMAIRQHVEWNGTKFKGYIDYGTGLDDDQLPIAKEAWVLMLNAINGNWKIPIGYFLINGLGASERANFINLALN